MNYKRLLLISSCVTIVVSGCAVQETTQVSVQTEKVQKTLAPNYVKHNPTAVGKHVEATSAVSGKPCAFIEVTRDPSGFLHYQFTDSWGQPGNWYGHGHMHPRNQACNLGSVTFSTVTVTSGSCGSHSEVVIDGVDTTSRHHHWKSKCQDGYPDDDVTWQGS